jgi:hypothetical protein
MLIFKDIKIPQNKILHIPIQLNFNFPSSVTDVKILITSQNLKKENIQWIYICSNFLYKINYARTNISI